MALSLLNDKFKMMKSVRTGRDLSSIRALSSICTLVRTGRDLSKIIQKS